MMLVFAPQKNITEEAVGASLSAATWIEDVLGDMASTRPEAGPAIRFAFDLPILQPQEAQTIGGYQPQTEIGRKLLELRKAFTAKGGRFLNRQELDEEIKLRKGRRE